MATSNTTVKRKAIQETAKFDLVIGPYVFKLVNPSRGKWNAAVYLDGARAGWVEVPGSDRVPVYRSSRKGMIEYLRYAYGAKRKPSIKIVTAAGNASTTLVRPAKDLKLPCPAASDTRVPGCDYSVPDGFNEALSRFTSVPDHGDDIAKAVSNSADGTPYPNQADDYIVPAVSDSAPKPSLKELLAGFDKVIYGPICTALDFKPEGPDVRDQIVENINDLRSSCVRVRGNLRSLVDKYGLGNGGELLDELNLRSSCVRVRGNLRSLVDKYGLRNGGELLDELVVKAYDELNTQNDNQADTIAALDAELAAIDSALGNRTALQGYTDRATKINAACNAAGRTDALDRNLSQLAADIASLRKQRDELAGEAGFFAKRWSDLLMHTTCTTLAQYKQGFWTRIWKAVRNA